MFFREQVDQPCGAIYTHFQLAVESISVTSKPLEERYAARLAAISYDFV
jgi:hypothetical protein